MLFPGAIHPLLFKNRAIILLFKNRAIHFLLFQMRATAVFRYTKKKSCALSAEKYSGRSSFTVCAPQPGILLPSPSRAFLQETENRPLSPCYMSIWFERLRSTLPIRKVLAILPSSCNPADSSRTWEGNFLAAASDGNFSA